MWFVFRAYEQGLPWLGTGQNVRITTQALPNKTFTAKISFIDPNLDEATRSANIRVELPNPPVNGKRELLNRLFADGQVELVAPSVLTVPRSAVLQTGPEALVYIDHGSGGYERRVVQTGRRGDTYQEILTGIKPAERVVTNGNLLIDGQAEMNRAFMPPAAAEPAAKAKPFPESIKTCLVSGEKLGEMGEPYVFVYEGQEVKLCCKDCLKKFDKEPAKYLAKINAAATAAPPPK